MAALAELHPQGDVRADLLVQLPGATRQTLDEIASVVRELAAGHPLVAEVHALLDADLGKAGPGGVLARRYDELYYAHDSTGTVCRRLAAAYPSARRICIGDAFGMVYPAEYVTGYQRSPWGRIRRRLGAILRGVPDLPAILPNLAALILPVDPSGRALADTPLVCISRANFISAIDHCHANASALREYMTGLLADAGGARSCLMLTETYSESGHMTPEREAGMYALIVRRYCAPGTVILVKPHPLEDPGKTERLSAAVGASYVVRAMTPRFGRYPIEIWRELLLATDVISTAYPVLSLKYAYGIDVLQPLDDEMIGRWFEPSAQAWTRDGLSLYSEPLARLAKWDGASVLWSKPL